MLTPRIVKETTDFKYEDKVGDLTRLFRTTCEGTFPSRIPERRDMSSHPITYFIEVKTTTTTGTEAFELSTQQYDLVSSQLSSER